MKKKNSDLLRVSSLNCLFRNSFFFLLVLPRVFLSLSLSFNQERARQSRDDYPHGGAQGRNGELEIKRKTSLFSLDRVRRFLLSSLST